MIINGRDALTSVETGISGARDNETRLGQVLSSAAAEADRLRKQLADAFRGLALLRLDGLLRNQVVGELDAAERRAVDLMRSHKARLDQTLIRCGGAQSVVLAAEADCRQKGAAVQAAREPIAALQARVEAEMMADPAWTAQQAKLKSAMDVATAADAKAKQSEADQDTKRKPYEADPLFMYLWKGKFGTAEYRTGTFARYFDRQVAALVGFDAARPNYALLNEIPLRLREHANVALKAAHDEDVVLEAIERGALMKAGIAPLEVALSEAEVALKKSSDALSLAQQSLTALDQERTALQGDGDRKVHEDALGVLSQAIALESLQSLYQAARQTPTADDDRLVQQIEQSKTAIAKADADVARIRDEARAAAGRRSELETVRDQMRSNRYDRPGNRFDLNGPDVLGGLIGGIIGGAIQSGVMWDLLRQSHRGRDRDDDDDDRDDDDGGEGGEGGPWGRRKRPQFRFPNSSFPKMGGGFGGGGFRSGGGFGGGGGFKTGGKF